LKTIEDIELLKILQILFKQKFYEVKESCSLLHFYFKSPYGLTSCSYNKLSIIKNLGKEKTYNYHKKEIIRVF